MPTGPTWAEFILYRGKRVTLRSYILRSEYSLRTRFVGGSVCLYVWCLYICNILTLLSFSPLPSPPRQKWQKCQKWQKLQKWQKWQKWQNDKQTKRQTNKETKRQRDMQIKRQRDRESGPATKYFSISGFHYFLQLNNLVYKCKV